MRVQFFAFCSQVDEVFGEGYTLHGVGGNLELEGEWNDPTSTPRMNLRKTLVVGLEGGTIGQHRAWLVAETPGQSAPITTAEMVFNWATDNPSSTIIFDLNIDLPAISGTYEFHIFVDNDPLGVALLPITVELHTNR